ncbi:MAG: serine/threonine-protein phosphatase [Oscillospiraceae bacterium]|nr:serine/threonine-protein phosphatase [Oscillospiraceae bacterium]
MSLFRRRPRESPPAQERNTPSAPAPVPAAPPPRRLSYRLGNLQGVGNRERQEDSFAFVNAMDVHDMLEQGLFAVVADGMGGLRDGKQASETAIAVLRAEFRGFDRGGGLGEQLRDAVKRAGEAVYAALGGQGGSTVVACLIYDGKLWYASVGDSFLWLLRDGELLRLNREDNMMNLRWLECIRRGDFDPAAGREDPEAAALTRFLGMEGFDGEIDFLRRPLALRDGDALLLCSDGVGAVLSDETVRDCLRFPSPEQSCAALERAVLLESRPYQDNYTALVIRCGI